MKVNEIKTIEDLVIWQAWGYPDIESILNDDFSENGRIHNWRNYVDDEFKECWQSLSKEVKLVIYMMAERQADREEWE